MADGDITWIAVAVLVFILLVFTIVFNLVTKGVVKIFKILHLPPMFLVAIFKELAILGLISFTLFFMGTLFLDSETKHLIEVVHMGLFSTTAVYILFVVMLLFLSSTIIRRLRYLERKVQTTSNDEKTDKSSSSTFKQLKSVITSKRILNKFHYGGIRRNLIVAHNLPDDYPYYRYVRKCLQEVLVHITEVDFKVWLIVEVLVFICLFMDVITGEFSQGEAVFLLLLVQYIMVAISIAMIIKAKFIIKSLAKMDVNSIKIKKKVKRDFLNQQLKTFCPCTMTDVNQTSLLFWLKSKGLFRGMIQMMLLIQALCIALLILTIGIWVETGPVFSPIAIFAFAIAVIWNLFFAIPYLIPIYAISAYSAEFADLRLLAKCLPDSANRSSLDDLFPLDEDDDDSIEFGSEASLYLPPEVSLKEPFLTKDVL